MLDYTSRRLLHKLVNKVSDDPGIKSPVLKQSTEKIIYSAISRMYMYTSFLYAFVYTLLIAFFLIYKNFIQKSISLSIHVGIHISKHVLRYIYDRQHIKVLLTLCTPTCLIKVIQKRHVFLIILETVTSLCLIVASASLGS